MHTAKPISRTTDPIKKRTIPAIFIYFYRMIRKTFAVYGLLGHMDKNDSQETFQETAQKRHRRIGCLVSRLALV